MPTSSISTYATSLPDERTACISIYRIPQTLAGSHGAQVFISTSIPLCHTMHQSHTVHATPETCLGYNDRSLIFTILVRIACGPNTPTH